MSRAINVDASAAAVTKMCAEYGAAISAIEPLLSGGTRVFLLNGDGAATMRKAFSTKIFDGPVVRTRWVRNG